MNNLASNKCGVCNKETPVLNKGQIADLLREVNGWEVVNNHHIFKKWHFKNFAKPLKFVNAIAKIAEEAGHHPNINFSWGYVEVTIWTHAIDGLTKNDFILAAKIDAIVL